MPVLPDDTSIQGLSFRNIGEDLRRLRDMYLPDGDLSPPAESVRPVGATPGLLFNAPPAGASSQRIVEITQRSLSVRSNNTNYYQDPRVACASFVSTVLIEAGL